MKKKALWIALPSLSILALVVGMYFWMRPYLQDLIIKEVSALSRSYSPVEIKISEVDWSLLSLKVSLSEVMITPKEKTKENSIIEIPEVKIKKVFLYLDIFYLALGKIKLSSAILDGLTTSYDISPLLKDNGEKKPIPLEALFKYLPKIPLNKVSLENANIHLLLPQNMELRLDGFDLSLLLKKDYVDIQSTLKDGSYLWGKPATKSDANNLFPSIHEWPLQWKLNSRLYADNLDVSYLEFKTAGTFLKGSGSFPGFSKIHMNPQGRLQVSLNSKLDGLNILFQKLSIPLNLSGQVKVEGQFNLDPTNTVSSGFEFQSKALKINQYIVGDLQFNGKSEKNELQIPSLNITNDAGLIDLKTLILKWNLKPLQLSLESKVKADYLDLNRLLILLNIGDLPLELFLKGDLACGGPLYPDLQFKCGGKIHGDSLEIRKGPLVKDTIVRLDEMGATGDFTVTSKNISYNADVQVKDDQGRSEGVISFAEGFKVSFFTPRFQFKNLRYLVGLKLEGEAHLEGNTQGDSHAATLDMNINGKDLFLSQFYLGQAQTSLNYKKGLLTFKNIIGKIGGSEYKANVEVDAVQSLIQVDGGAEKADVKEIMTAFQRLVQLPIELTGIANVKVKGGGPFELNQLSYQLEAEVFKSTIANESFEKIEAKLVSQNGEVKIEKALLKKQKSEIRAFGVGHPNGDIDLTVQGKDLLLEESENIARLGAFIQGRLDATLKLQGYVLAPDSKLDLVIKQLSIEDQEFPGSEFNFVLGRKQISGKANLVGGHLLAELIWPLAEDSPFYLKAKANNWNYTTLFTLVGGGSILSDYTAGLSGDIELSSVKGGFANSTGSGKITSLFLKRGNLSLYNQGPMELTAKSGMFSLQNFRLIGEQSYLELKGSQFSTQDLKLKIAGQTNLRLLQIFVPFLEELSGASQLSVQFSGSLFKPEILGTTNIQNGYVKMKGFPHPFEKIEGEAQFSQHKINIDFFRGLIAGGKFQGDGYVQIEGVRNIPTFIRARLEDVHFNVPDKIKTNGSADIIFSGNWFPFILSGTYEITSGLMEKEFTESESAKSLKQSSYLPKVILQSAFEPVLLDLNAVFPKGFIMKNSLVNGELTGALQIKGPPTSPALIGEVKIVKASQIIFKDKAFETLNGLVQFKDTGDLFPELFISARSRVTEYDVNLLVQGNAKNPVIRVSSVPPLSEQDIISLLALGITSQKLEKKVESRQSENSTSYEIGTAIIANNPLTKNLQQTLGVNLQFSSQYDDTKNIAVQKVTLSRNLTPKLAAQASRLKGEQNSTEVKLNYQLNTNLSVVGSWENREISEQTSSINQGTKPSNSILGIDLEFKREFK